MVKLTKFDAARFEPISDREPIPPGKYPAVITDSTMKTTKAGDGRYLELTLGITEGTYAEHRLWDRLNIKNPSKAAEEFAWAKLSTICRAVGVMTPHDTSELHNIPLVIHVTQRQRDDTGEIVNEIKSYSAAESPQNAPADDTDDG